MISNLELIEFTMANKLLNLELGELSKLAFNIAKYLLWREQLEKGRVVTKWGLTTKKDTSYEVKLAKNQAEYDNNLNKFKDLVKEISKYNQKDIVEAHKILREYIDNKNKEE